MGMTVQLGDEESTLNDLSGKLGKSKVSVIKTSLRFMHMVVQRTREGNRLYFQDQQGNLKEFIGFF